MPMKRRAPRRSEPAVAVESAIKGASATQQIVARAESFAGPLPHPDLLKKYDEVLPGTAERILAMAEEEQRIRHEAITADCQNKATLVAIAAKESSGSLKSSAIGQIIGLLVSVFCIGCALYCAVVDKPIAVTIGFLSVPTASFIGSFMPRLFQRGKKDSEAPYDHH